MLQNTGYRITLVVLGSFCCAALFFLAGSDAFGENKPAKLSGKQVFETKCLHCHKPEKFTSQRHDRREWEQILSRMELNTCNLTDAEAEAVAQYLIKEHGY